MPFEPAERARSAPRVADPLRHMSTLGSLSCWLCGAGPFVECDVAAHQEYANSLHECSACGAGLDEVCTPQCPAANAVMEALSAVQAV